MQSFIDQYNYELRTRLSVFDGQFKPQIVDGRRQLQKVCIYHVLALLSMASLFAYDHLRGHA